MESATARIMADLALFGPGRIPIEDDPLPETRDFADGVAGLIATLAEAFDGSAMEAHLEDLAWGLVNLFHRKIDRLERELRVAESECRTLIKDQDGSEVRSVELERATDKAKALAEHIAEFETMRERLADEFANVTGSTWKPRSGTRKRQAGLTSAVTDARAFMAARRERELDAHAPKGPLIAFSGGADWSDVGAIFRILDKIRARHPDMVLAHTAQERGADLIAARWAEARQVDQIAFRPDFARYFKAAPFRRNDAMIAAGLAGCVIFPGSGITANLGQKAAKAGVSVIECGRSS